MKKLNILTDYKGNFGSKWDAVPYVSGFDKKLLTDIFKKANIKVEYFEMSDIENANFSKGDHVLYTSSEDIGFYYKSFIEDVIYYLELQGVDMIPEYKLLKANNNKVFMELLRRDLGSNWGDKLKSWVFGTLPEMEEKLDEFTFPIVIKTAEGAMSRGVSLAHNKSDLIKKVKLISQSKHLKQDLKDRLRPYKHKGYKVNSLYRRKFILQSFVPDLKNDWKILIFGDRYFIITRHTRKGDFRASGSHTNYLAGSKAIIPDGLFEFAKKVFDGVNAPHLSIDVVFDGSNFHLVEFQALYFGTSTINMSDVYFIQKGNNWEQVKITESIEQIYADSVIRYLNKVND